MYSCDNPVSSAIFIINSLSYTFIPSFSATNLPTYLPPEAYSLAIVITTCFESLLSVFFVVSLFTIFTFPCFSFLTSLIKNIVANMNANPSANGPANRNSKCHFQCSHHPPIYVLKNHFRKSCYLYNRYDSRQKIYE